MYSKPPRLPDFTDRRLCASWSNGGFEVKLTDVRPAVVWLKLLPCFLPFFLVPQMCRDSFIAYLAWGMTGFFLAGMSQWYRAFPLRTVGATAKGIEFGGKHVPWTEVEIEDPFGPFEFSINLPREQRLVLAHRHERAKPHDLSWLVAYLRHLQQSAIEPEPTDTNDCPARISSTEISPTFVMRFNQAATLVRNERVLEALLALERIYNEFDDSAEPRVVTKEFRGLVEMRKAYLLMDLGRYEEALAVMTSPIVETSRTHFSNELLYDHFFSLGNIHGNLGNLEKMDKAMMFAIDIASEELNFLEKCNRAFYWTMYWAKEAEEWDFLEEQCQAAHSFGVLRESYWLQHQASEFGCHAYRGQGRLEGAQLGARLIIERLTDGGADAERIDNWREFQREVDEKVPTALETTFC
jgi:hypothetical protein